MSDEPWQDLLTQAGTLWAASRQQSRDAKLAVGRLLWKYLQQRLAPVAGLRRCPPGTSRQALIGEAAKQLGVKRDTIICLVNVAAAVDLLSASGDCGSLSWAAVRAFRGAVQRQPRSAEVWTVRHPATRFVSLFRQAVREGWHEEQILPRVGTPSERRGPPPAEQYHVSQSRSALEALRESAAVGTPRDVADTLYAVLEAAPDPVAVAEQLLRLARGASRRPVGMA